MKRWSLDARSEGQPGRRPFEDVWKREEFCPTVAMGPANYETGITIGGIFLFAYEAPIATALDVEPTELVLRSQSEHQPPPEFYRRI